MNQNVCFSDFLLISCTQSWLKFSLYSRNMKVIAAVSFSGQDVMFGFLKWLGQSKHCWAVQTGHMIEASVWFVQGGMKVRGGGVRWNSRWSHRVGECMNGPSVRLNLTRGTKIITTQRNTPRFFWQDINIKEIRFWSALLILSSFTSL